eukprot:1181107-Prorocentrum_minimum.AAC.1
MGTSPKKSAEKSQSKRSPPHSWCVEEHAGRCRRLIAVKRPDWYFCHPFLRFALCTRWCYDPPFVFDRHAGDGSAFASVRKAAKGEEGVEVHGVLYR